MPVNGYSTGFNTAYAEGGLYGTAFRDRGGPNAWIAPGLTTAVNNITSSFNVDTGARQTPPTFTATANGAAVWLVPFYKIRENRTVY